MVIVTMWRAKCTVVTVETGFFDDGVIAIAHTGSAESAFPLGESSIRGFRL